MRRKDREIGAEEALAVVDKCDYAVLSMTGRQGRPYCVPLSVAREKDRIYFHCAIDGEKADNLRENPYVCMACVGDTCPAPDRFTIEYESAIVRGVARELVSEKEKIHALRLICRRHAPTNTEGIDGEIAGLLDRTAVWSVKIEEVTGKRNKRKS